ncbi:MAG TPA: c-type cytochrome [Longimicrobiaceae bacterium]|nr:c-type cytochrome [Longimicrobiaceae bacterium]
MRRWRGMIVALALLAGALGGCGRGEPESSEPAKEASGEEVQPFDQALAARLPQGETETTAREGRKLFVTCAVCHGLDARGTQLGPSLRDGEWIDIDGSLPRIEQVIRDGIPDPKEADIPMPVLGGGAFSPEQVHALAVYVYALSRDRTTEKPDST